MKLFVRVLPLLAAVLAAVDNTLTIMHVSPLLGADTPTCGGAATPCQTIGWASTNTALQHLYLAAGTHPATPAFQFAADRAAPLVIEGVDSTSTVVDCDAVAARNNSGSGTTTRAFVFAGADATVGGGVVLTKLTIQRCTSFTGGSALTAYNENVTLVDVRLVDNWSYGNGGAVVAAASDGMREAALVALFNVDLVNNTNAGSGDSGVGGAVVMLGISAFVSNSRFVGNQGDVGAGLFAISATVAIVDSEFRDHRPHSQLPANSAGAVGAVQTSQMSVVRTLFENNMAWCNTRGYGFGGGMLLTDSVSAVIIDSVFRQNRVMAAGPTREAYILGAALAITTTSPVSVTNCTFESNSAEGATATGGAVSVNTESDVALTHTLTNCTFTDNTAEQSGGAAGLSGSSTTVVVDGAVMEGNSAGAGGAIASKVPLLTIRRSTFSFNHATTQQGGAVFQQRGLIVEESDFFDNTAPGAGGAVYATESSADEVTMLTQVRMARNSAYYGGGLYLTSRAGNNVITELLAINNTASEGGGTFSVASSAVNYVDCQFVGNVANIQGGGSVVRSSAEVHQNSQYIANSSPQGGGALLIYGGSAGYTNSVFSRNTGGVGGGLSMTLGSAVFVNSEISLNSADNRGGGVFMDTSSTLLLNNSVVSGNYLTSPQYLSGAGIHSLQSTVFMNFCNISDHMYARAVSLSDGNFVSSHSLWKSNLAGALSLESTSSEIQSDTFLENSMSTAFYETDGGAVSVQTAQVRISFTNFFNNSALDGGGALRFYYGNSEIIYCQFKFNFANWGAGIAHYADYFADLGTPQITILNSIFDSNTADVAGGGLILGSFDTGYCSARPVACAIQQTIEQQMWFMLFNNTIQNNVARFGAGLYIQSVIPYGIFNNTWFNNMSPYGVLSLDVDGDGRTDLSGVIAQAERVSISTWPSHSASGELFSEAAEAPISMVPVDHYGQTVNSPDESTGVRLVLTLLTPQLDENLGASSLFGPTTLLPDSAGVYSLDYNGIRGTPGTAFVLKIRTDIDYGFPDILLPIQLDNCSVGEYVPENRIGCSLCPPNTYNRVAGGECKDCPTGADCLGGANIEAEDGYWYDAASDAFYSCPLGYCVGGGCTENRMGTLCGECMPGFTKWGGKCLDCASRAQSAWVWVLAVVIGFGFVHWMTWPTEKKASSVLSIGTFFAQTIPLLIVGARANTDAGRFLTPIIAPFSFNIEISGNTCVDSFNFYDKYTVVVLTPVFLHALLLIHFIGNTVYRRIVFAQTGKIPLTEAYGTAFTPSLQFYLRTSIAILKFMYLPITKAVFEAFACDNSVPKQSLLIADYALSCSTETHRRFLGVSIALTVLFVIPFPVVVPLFYRHVQRSSQERQSVFSAMYLCYRPRLFWYEFAVLFRRTLFVFFFVVFSSNYDLRSLVLLYFAIFLFATHMFLLPFQETEENTLESLSLFTICIVAATFVSPWLLESRPVSVGVLLVCLPTLMAIFVLAVRKFALGIDAPLSVRSLSGILRPVGPHKREDDTL
eukprot:TRINITY_DN1026_c0_g1_i1.p1 TRINITY_DN1026_c0_g1~~TRINITY_DN1026_c0_g1_i1.p1  ORF type:complete len:1525 (-),score=393.03 TRINITY_DN1026_c0_g1_i1:32-4579(-)